MDVSNAIRGLALAEHVCRPGDRVDEASVDSALPAIGINHVQEAGERVGARAVEPARVDEMRLHVDDRSAPGEGGVGRGGIVLGFGRHPVEAAAVGRVDRPQRRRGITTLAGRAVGPAVGPQRVDCPQVACRARGNGAYSSDERAASSGAPGSMPTVYSSPCPSCASNHCFAGSPHPKRWSVPSDATTRWHGTNNDAALRAQTWPAARTPRGTSIRFASSP